MIWSSFLYLYKFESKIYKSHSFHCLGLYNKYFLLDRFPYISYICMQIYICEYVKFSCPTEKCAGAVESLQLPEDPTIYGLRFRVYGVRLTGHYGINCFSPLA